MDHPCYFITASTRSAMSGGSEKVMVLVVRDIVPPVSESYYDLAINS